MGSDGRGPRRAPHSASREICAAGEREEQPCKQDSWLQGTPLVPVPEGGCSRDPGMGGQPVRGRLTGCCSVHGKGRSAEEAAGVGSSQRSPHNAVSRLGFEAALCCNQPFLQESTEWLVLGKCTNLLGEGERQFPPRFA